MDIDLRTWCLDAAQLELVSGPRVKAVIVSHPHGGLAALPQIRRWAADQRVGVVEDACQVPGATPFGRPAGSGGDDSIAGQNFGEALDDNIGQRRLPQQANGSLDIVSHLFELHVFAITDCVASLTAMVPGETHAARVDHGDAANRAQSLKVSMPQENEIGRQPRNPLRVVVLVQVLEQVPLRRSVGQVEVPPLPLKPLNDWRLEQ